MSELMELLSSSPAPVPTAGSAPSADWVARGLTVLGFALTIVLFFVTRSSQEWQRKAKATKNLEPSFKEIQEILAQVEQSGGQYLWAPGAHVQLTQLEESGRESPDREIRSLTADYVARVRGAKGDVQPVDDEVQLTHKQLKQLRAANTVGDSIERRITKIKQKGGSD